ncbi:flavin monoamine oxidase family protein [Aerosakkonema funiforme]|uniref:flavin monoamine oxidase family protein n=1 Tax=Aerosakkonema funiforme TaxID=1246630 RepID=UPI0035B9E3FF
MNDRSKFNPFRHTQQFDRPFSFEALYSHPGDLLLRDRGGDRKRIGIIGGGIAGLTSGYELSQLGHEVTILEAGDRLGGRIRTHYFSDGTYGELGAMRIPNNHRCAMYYLEKFNLPTRPFVSYNPAGFYYLRGKKARIDAFAELFAVFDLLPQELQDPAILYDDLLRELTETLSCAEKWEMFCPSFSSTLLKKYDSISFAQYFRDRLSQEAFEMVGHTTGMSHYERVSLLEGSIDFFSWYRVEQYQLIGGMETLVNAFAKRVQGKIELNAKVTAIEIIDRGAIVRGKNFDSSFAKEFDYIICTVPATVLATIEFAPDIPAKKKQANRSLTYGSAAKTLFHCTARPWELHDRIYGGASFTDLPIQQIWYPSDNAKLATLTKDDRTDYRWIPRDPEVSHHPSVFTAGYRWEDNSRKFLTLNQRDRTDTTLHQVKQLHPQIDRYVDEIVHWSWDEQIKPGSGAYAYFTPGDHEEYQEVLCQPFPLDNPRVFFAGEHLAINHASIQGAIQTALSATIDILEM